MKIKQRPAFLVSIALAVFLFLIIGGVLVKALSTNSTSVVSAQTDLKATLRVYQEREEAYQELLEQANQQLNEVNATRVAAAATSSDSVGNSSGVTAQEAVEIAQKAAVNAKVLSPDPELVNFEGKAAYEVKFTQGAIYISYSTGEILMNGTASLTPQEINIDQAVEIARNYLGLQDVYQSDIVTINGQQLFRTIFNAGHFVYVDHFGQIIYVQMYSPSNQTSSSNDSESSSNSSTETHDDDDDDHYDEPEHDDD